MALRKALMGIGFRFPGAAIPHDHGAAAIFALGDDAFPVEIINRVVFGLDRQAFLACNEPRAARHCPAFEYTIKLKSEVEMNPSRVVLLHHELPALDLGDPGPGFGRLLEVALLAIGLEAARTPGAHGRV